MKKFLATLLCAAAVAGASAQDFTLPKPIVVTPISGSEHFYGLVQVTWGFYNLKIVDRDAAVTFTWPDGRTKAVKPKLSDANPEGVFETLYPNPPAITDNAIDFLNVNYLEEGDRWDWVMVDNPGKYTFTIPAGLVEVNGVLNEETEMSFTISGEVEVPTMPRAELVYPSSDYTSYLFGMQVMWNGGQEVAFADGSQSAQIRVELDGGVTRFNCNAFITNVIQGDEDTGVTEEICVLVADLPEFIPYTEATIVDFILPEGLVVNADGEVNPDQTVTFTLLGQSEGSAFPGTGAEFDVEDGNKVVISWDGVDIQPGTGKIQINQTNVSPYVTTYPEVTFDEEKPEVTVSLDGLKDGLYEVVVPEGFVIVLQSEGANGDQYALSSEMILEYTIGNPEDSSRVELVESAEGKAEYFNLHGVKVANPEKGKIYISNGKAVVVK